MKEALLVAAALAVLPAALLGEVKLSYLDLIKRLTDLECLAVLPQPGEQCAQWSSWDRKSQYNETTGKYENWDANGDGTGFIRMEGSRQVLAEMAGPGCIWRIWSADPQMGQVQVFLDGAAEPAIDLPFKRYFNGNKEPFTRSTLVHTVAAGWNNYTPIPYQTSCKILAETNWGRFFHFGYATFPKGTTVPTFRRELDAAESAALDQADHILTQGGVDPAGIRPGQKVVNKTLTIAPGSTMKLVSLKGPRAIVGIRAKVNLPGPPGDRAILRELALRIRWDGETAPAVWSPFGDFFGTAGGANAYLSLPSGLRGDGWWYSRWYMPFATSAVMELSNDGQSACHVTFEITHARLDRPIAELGRFHAKWHRDTFPPAEPERQIDWTILKTEGTGRFVGVMLHVWNPKGRWWGEGDEKFFVDGEKFPSTFGTGSEDYFGYGWGNSTLFQNCYHSQTMSTRNKAHASLNRWHISDNVPFQKSFEGCIEKYFPNDRPTLYACVSYWYLAPGGIDGYPEARLSERTGYWTDDTSH